MYVKIIVCYICVVFIETQCIVFVPCKNEKENSSEKHQ